ncbi:MAG TPA: glutathione S-transferase family protein [Polyangiaceae bacterium]|nr:glutathione S-transferase family protein [Polyangiaceae bacterium]
MTVVRLYTARQTRGARPRWVLEELGIPYELVELDDATEEQKRRHRELHPLGRVPALEHGDRALFESAALCLYIADLDPEHRLLPEAGTAARGEVTKWLFFLMTELESALDLIAFHVADLPQEQRVSAIVPWARARFDAAAAVVEKELARTPFLADGQLSIADIVLASMMSWATRRKLLDAYPQIRAHMQRMLDRPTARRLFATSPPS